MRAPSPRRPPRDLFAALVAGVILVGAMSFLVYPVVHGPPTGGEPLVEILEPRGWAYGIAAPTEVPVGGAVPISGLARHTGPITDVRMNGLRLARTFSAGGTAVEFGGFVNADDVAADGTVAIEVRGAGGVHAGRRFPVSVVPGGDGPRFADVDRGERSQRWAVVIGAGAFADPALAPDPGAAADARLVADFLRSPAAGLGGFDSTRVRLLLDHQATLRHIQSGLKTFLRSATPGDLVIFYLAGRVVPDPDRPDRTFLLAWDTDPTDIPATAVDLRFLRDAIEEVYGHTRVVIADLAAAPGAVRSAGELLRDSTIARQGGLAVLAATEPGRGDLTAALLQGLAGSADRDRDGIVRLAEATAFTVREAAALLAATSFDGSWPLAAVPARTARAAPARAPDR